MGRDQTIPRPIRKTEYTIKAGTARAQKGWSDLKAAHRNVLVDAWEHLTAHPHERTPTNYPLKGDQSTITRDGKTYQRWQHKPTEGGTARIWFYVDGKTVILEELWTHHPNATK